MTKSHSTFSFSQGHFSLMNWCLGLHDVTFVTLRFRSLRALPSAPSTFGSQRSHHSAPNINSFLKTVTDFMKMLSGLGHPSFKSLAAYKNKKNFTDSFSKFFFPPKGPTEDIIPWWMFICNFQLNVLPKKYSFKIFTRATPGNSLVENNFKEVNFFPTAPK